MICINFHHRPISWKRPAQNGAIRYDSQKSDKALLSFDALLQLKNMILPKALANKLQFKVPLFKKPIVAIEVTFKEKSFFDKQDVDNIAKFYLDLLQSESLKGVIWYDDADVQSLAIKKELGSSNKVQIKVSSLIVEDDILNLGIVI